MLPIFLACSTPRPPDVLLVVMDTTRPDRLATYGHNRPTSNQLTAIAAAGVMFEDVTAPSSWTWPSHASLLTGLMPWEHGAHWAPSPEGALVFSSPDTNWQLSPLRPEVPTIAERFSAGGYRTVALSANCLLHPELGLVRGFEEAACTNSDALVLERLRSSLAAADDRPLFVFVNLMSAHAPYTVADRVPFSAAHTARVDPAGVPLDWTRPYLSLEHGPGLHLQQRPVVEGPNGEEAFASGLLPLSTDDLTLISDLYDGNLVRLDNALTAVIGAWNETNRSGVVAVTADHGEHLGEHGELGHGDSLYTEGLAVPLVLVAPGLPAGQRIAAPVGLSTLGPSLLELAGLSEPTTDSLAAIARGGPDPSAPIFAALWPQRWRAKHIHPRYDRALRYVRQGELAAVVADEGAPALFDLHTDPGMTTDLATARPQDAAHLAGLLAATREEAPRTGTQADVSADVLEQLQALGYVGEAP